MKTAEQWQREYGPLVVSGKTVREMVEAIQRDARAEGMREAARIAAAIGPCSGTRDWNESRWLTIKNCVNDINAAAERLEKGPAK